MTNISAPKLIAMYFPQFHAIPENSKWWGEGFTDWNNVRAAQQQFEGHYQPRVPLNKNYYDQSKIETIKWQIDLAKAHNIFGFCHYHYWFDGKQMLETPTNLFLEDKSIDFPFCLSWANETWSRRWDGRNRKILIRQTHPPTKERWKAHFDYLIKAWSDPRAIRVDGKPVFVIYRPQYIEKIDDMIDYWRELAVEAGLSGLYLLAQFTGWHYSRSLLKSFDGVFQFQPFETLFSPEIRRKRTKYASLLHTAHRLPEPAKDVLHDIRLKLTDGLKFYDYDSTWEHIVKVRFEEGLDTFPGAFLDWDNTARYKERALIFNNASPERFEYWFEKLADSMDARNLPEKFMFINAWNEWAEGTYLEPDEKYGYQYLEAIKRVLEAKKPEKIQGGSEHGKQRNVV